jgi:diguanylate cyclase (GGDEF)-like protein
MQCINLPSPPKVAARIIELAEDPTANICSVAETVSLDPALAAKILRMANSALYARQRKAENLRQAIILFGLDGTLTLALSFSLVSTLRASRPNGMDYKFFWQRSLAMAICSRLLGIQLRLGAKEELFLAGLLQDIGMLALDKAIPELYQEIGNKQVNHQFVRSIELEALNSDHAAVGAWLLQRWNLSDRLLYAVVGSHVPIYSDPDSEYAPFVKCAAVSSVMADILWSDDCEKSSQDTANLAHQLLGFSPETLSFILNNVADEMKATAALFEIDIGDTVLIEHTIEQSKELLMLRNLKVMHETEVLYNATASLESRTLELEEKTRRDGLIGLYNRAYLDHLLNQEITSARRQGWPLTIAFLDIDHFKRVNDTYGHAAGDQILKATAKLLIANTRESDTVARYGGEEFVIVLPGIGLEGARLTCERIVNAFRTTRHEASLGIKINISVSVGAAIQGESLDFENAESIVHAADRAVYAAKTYGRDCYIFYDPGMDLARS